MVNHHQFLALQEIQQEFYRAFPTHEKETVYGFECTSSLKPTRTTIPDSSLNQIPGEFAIRGDIRLTPFYLIKDAMTVIEKEVERLNTEEGLRNLQNRVKAFRGPDSHYIITENDNQLKGQLILSWLCSPIQGKVKGRLHYQNNISQSILCIL